MQGVMDESTERPGEIPEHLWESIRRYVLEGRPTGSFLTAVFSNDLFGAYARADDEASAAVRDIVVFVHNRCPIGCHGSLEKVAAWRERGGLDGCGGAE